MKLLTLLITVACLNLAAAGYAQKITLSVQDASLQKVFKLIEKQTEFRFVYAKEQLQHLSHVSLKVKSVTLENVLAECLKEHPLSYTIEDNVVVIQQKEPQKKVLSYHDVSGRVTNPEGQPVSGITIKVKGASVYTVTNDKGEFKLANIDKTAILVVTGAEVEAQEIQLDGQNFIELQVKSKLTELDQLMVMAYGTTTKRLNTGNITRVSSEEINRQPVANPLLALQGRVTGLAITQASGLNGAAVKVEIRGRNSILQGSEPFYIIDGIPYAPGNSRLNQVDNATSETGMSPFYLLNPADIESIEVLKDADATAIYGSRAANGVILITTKKGVVGKPKLNAIIYSGFSKVTRTMDMLNTQQYTAMRREAFANDGLVPSASPGTRAYAPDLMLWDTTRYTNLKKLLIGGTAHTNDAQLSYSGGNSNTQFLIGAGYHRETTVFPSDHNNTKGSVHFNFNQVTNNKRFELTLNGNYVDSRNELNIRDLTSFINLPPNIKLYDDQGQLNWMENGTSFRTTLFRPNPLAVLKNSYKGNFKNLVTNLQLNFRLLPGLHLKSNLGYNTLHSEERSAEPSTSFDPNSGNKPSATFANRTRSSWIVEPQAEYTKAFQKTKLKLLLGATWQQNVSDGMFVQGLNYTSDLSLGSISGAATAYSSSNYTQYRYTALFGRINYMYREKYIINLSGRRDGSSRFGPANRFSNFGAAGIAWLFSKQKWIQDNFSILSFGKIRSSYGVTGNDQIGDYQYLDTWNTAYNNYQGIPVLAPSSLLNANFSWEKTRKLELAIELGFVDDRLNLTAAWFRNRSSNQLINYTLPVQTGASSILKNLNALLQNTGLELQLSSRNVNTKHFSWSSSINLTLTRNKLITFPGLASSSYSRFYFIGHAVTTRLVYNFLGVDPVTGLYRFEDVDRNGLLNATDRTQYVNTDPEYYGGFSNALTFKQFQLDILLEFKKQKGYDYLSNNRSAFIPGYGLTNHPVVVLDRWQRAGDITAVQKFAATSSSQAFQNISNFLPSSNANISDASFIRFKNIAATYKLPSRWLQKLKLEKACIYMHAQNIFTITKYNGSDPETQNMFVLPPLKTIVLGLQLTFN